MKRAVLEKLKPYIGQKVSVFRRHVTQTSWLEGTFEGTEGESNWTYMRIRVETRFPGSSGIRLLGLNRIIKVMTEDGEVWR